MGRSKEWLNKQHDKATKGGNVIKERWDEIKRQYNENPSKCSYCGSPLEYSKRNNKFCSKSCSVKTSNANRTITQSQKDKVSKSLFKGKSKKSKCVECGDDFVVPYGNKLRITCSDVCLHNSMVRAGRNGGRTTSKNGYVKRSKNEVQFSELCEGCFDSVLTNEPMFNGWDADIILKNEKIAILWNGIWHYKQLSFGNHKLKQVQYRDKIKLDEIKKAGYTPYIIKDMGSENPSFVESEFKKLLRACSSRLVRASVS